LLKVVERNCFTSLFLGGEGVFLELKEWFLISLIFFCEIKILGKSNPDLLSVSCRF